MLSARIVAAASRLRLSRIVRASAITGAAVIALAAVGIDYMRREAAIAEADRRMSNLAVIFTENIARSFEAIDLALQGAAEAHALYRSGRANPLSDPFQFLQTIQRSTPMLSGVSWVDADGVRTHSSVTRSPPALSVADQEQFMVHRDSPDKGFFISHPFRSVIDGRWFVIASRRVNFAGGDFAGVVQGSIDIDYLDRTYARIGIDQPITFTLLLTDGTVLARPPDSYRNIGRSLSGTPISAAAPRNTGAGVVHGASILDGPNGPIRIAAFGRVPSMPLIAVVSIEENEVLTNLQADSWVLALLALTLALVVLGGGLVLSRAMAENEAQQLALIAARNAAEVAQEAALAASRAKSRFLASMSHELRTPLNAVIGFAQMLQLKRLKKLPSTDEEYAGLILKSGNHLLTLVNEVLDLSGIEAGKLKLSLERVTSTATATAVYDTMLPIARKAGVTLSLEVEPDAADVRADATRLNQVLLNFVSNAVKYNHQGGAVTLRVAARAGDRMRFSVTDTGIGIPLERQNEIFEPFHRFGAEYTAVEGTGLGLAISKRLVEAMNGAIGFDSKAGEGSVFWVDMPADRETPAAREAAPVARAVADGPQRKPAYSVLYIEDNPSNLRLIADLLTTVPEATLITAPSPQIGLDLARAHRPSVVVLDIHLPTMDGYEVLARLRAAPETRGVPVVALTAAASAADIQRGIGAGFYRYLTKPIDVKLFLAAIEDAANGQPRAALGARSIG